MRLDINKERTKLIQIVNDVAFDWKIYIQGKKLSGTNSRINFLWLVLLLTIKYTHVEPYLKNLLNNFSINELRNIYANVSILHYMTQYTSEISLNAFEIIINYGLDVNSKSSRGDTPAHTLLLSRNPYSNHSDNVMNLLIKRGADINIANKLGYTVLDTISVHYGRQLNEEIKNCITTLLDSGGITYRTIRSVEMYDFVEYYKNSTIKPAIKNENKI